jgi:predicted alpha/beta superfamily hydrolase
LLLQRNVIILALTDLINMTNLKKLLLFATLIFCFNASAQYYLGAPDSVYSKTYNESRDLLVYLPKDIRDHKDSTAKYPVLYVLDGGAHFLAVSGMLKELSEFAGNMVLPKMIVVCIPSYNRNKELTPYPISKSKLVPEEIAKETGGAEDFTRFLETEVFNYIASKYPVSNSRTLIGHSFGGIFVLNVLAKHKNLFDNYIVIDPSTWYDERKFSKEVLDSLSKNNYAGKSLFVGIANTTEIEDTVEVKKQKTLYSEHERSILAFCTGVRTIKNNGLKFYSKYYPDDDHVSVPTIATYDGLRSIFLKNRFSYASVESPSFNPAIDIPLFFSTQSKQLGYTIPVPSDVLERCDAIYKRKKDLKRQKAVRDLYASLYPREAKKYRENDN